MEIGEATDFAAAGLDDVGELVFVRRRKRRVGPIQTMAMAST